jgi:2-O-methyltransferase
MSLLTKIWLKVKIEIRFLLEQKWGLRKSNDPYVIPKYLLKKYLPENPVIIDCGAHVGADSVELAKIFPLGTVHSFEPIPFLFDRLKYNTRHYSNVHCYQLALSDNDGNSTMHVSSGGSDASSSLMMPKMHIVDHPDVHFKNTVSVVTQTLDSWAAQNSIAKVDFLWLDMQGFEHSCLRQSVSILPSVKLIHSEVSVKESYEGSLLYSDFKKWLEGIGFELVVEAMPNDSDMGNALFARR